MSIEKYKKLVFVVEPIDPITGVNYFNGCSKTYYIEEENELLYPKVMEVNQWKHWFKNDKSVFNWLINTPFHDQCTYKQYNQLHSDEKYIYAINFYNVDFIESNKQIGFKCIPKPVLEDVRNNRAKILLHCSTEGYSGSNLDKHVHELDIIQDWIDIENLPSDNIVYINGNMISSKIKSSKVKYQVKGVCVMDGWIVNANVIDLNNYSVVDFKPNDNSYLYLNLTREPRPHRVYLLASLVVDNLLNLGKNSFNMLYANNHNGHLAYDIIRDLSYNFTKPNIIEGANHIDLIGKQMVDIDNTDTITSVNTFTKTMYEQTLLSIITETIVLSNTMLISEKTWKAIAIGHPFMIVGSKGILKQLKEMGYKTFDRWIDESYDNAETFSERVDIICNNIKILNENSLEELIKIRNEMKEVCVFNQNHFVNELRRKYYINDTFIKHKPVLDLLI